MPLPAAPARNTDSPFSSMRGHHTGIRILAGPGASAQPVYPDVDASLVANGFNHVCLSVENVDATLAALRERGVDIVNPPFEIDDISARLAFFRDTWGNMFELSQRIGGGHSH